MCRSLAVVALLIVAVLASSAIGVSEWERTGGPPGGAIDDIEIVPSNPSILYAAGSREGLYKTIDGGDEWTILPFPTPATAMAVNLIVDPTTPTTLYLDYSGLSKSTDGGTTWQEINDTYGDIAWTHAFAMDPLNPSSLYRAGRTYDHARCVVYKTTDAGATWTDITSDLPSPANGDVDALVALGTGKLLIGINDWQWSTWNEGRVYYSSNDGLSWSRVDYGSPHGERSIKSIFVNPFNLQEIWISEGPRFNEGITQPAIFKSVNGSTSWSSVTVSGLPFDDTQIRVIGSTSDGKTFVAGGSNLARTDNGGVSFVDITPPADEMDFADFADIAAHPANSNVLYLPLRGSGIAHSDDCGSSWAHKNNGLSVTSMNLIAIDPDRPWTFYASSGYGQGIFRTDDYGDTWHSISSDIHHPWGDQLNVDPHDSDTVWYVADVPYIFKSTNRGDSWTPVNPSSDGNRHAQKGTFNFNSIYAIGQSSDPDTIYFLDSGFGIFKGEGPSGGNWSWTFLHQSEVDYSYSLAVHPMNANIAYSGYIPKPFQDFAMVRRTTDGGDSWDTSLNVFGSSGITSVAIDPSSPSTLYAGSTGTRGEVYRSTNSGNSWTVLNDHFIMLTVWGQPQLIVDPSNPETAYAATWLGGTWKTTNAGNDWDLLGEAPVSSTALCLDAPGSNTVYSADRTAPKVWKSTTGGSGWTEVADFSSSGGFLLNRVVADGTTVYAATFGPGIHGGRLYKSTDGGTNWSDITGILPRSVLDLAINPSDPNTLYVTTHIYGAYKSTNGGTTWVEMAGFPDIGGYDIEVDPVTPSTLYACGLGGSVPAWCMKPSGYTFTDTAGVYKSTDSGATWTQMLATSNECRAVRLHPSNHLVVFAAAMDDGLQVSTDGGATWMPYNTGLDTQVLTSCAVAGERIYVGTQGCGVYAGDIDTNDWSITWQPSRSNKPVPFVYSLEIRVDPSDSSRIFVGANPGGLYRSDDNGGTFYDKNFLTPSVIVDDPYRQGYYTFAINPSDPEEVWLGTWGKGIFKSYDGMDFDITANGTTMEMYGKHVTQIAIDSIGTVYVATEEGVYRTSDGGDSWEAINTGLESTDVRSLYIGPSGDMYAGTRGYGLYKWSGSSWVAQNWRVWGVFWPIWDDRPLYQYTTLLFHPTDPLRMLIGTFPAGIYKSTDGGSTWRERNVGWTFDGVFSLVTHPDDPEIVYAGTYNGMNRSSDFGEHWAMWDEGMPPEQWVFSIAFDPRDADVMYACSKNGENEGTGREGFRGTVMKSTNGGESWFEITTGLDTENEFYTIIVDPAEPDTLYLASRHDGVHISTDAGGSWIPWNEGLGGLDPATNGNNVTDTMALSADGSTLYLGTHGAGVFRRVLRGQETPPTTGTPATFRVGYSGHMYADGTVYSASIQSSFGDIAEWVSLSGPAQSGTVVMLDSSIPGGYKPTSEACSERVAGVVSTEPGVVLGKDGALEQQALLALAGIVPVRVTNEGGPILPGDLLVTSSTSGHAMRWSGSGPCPCALVGKALEPMTGESGMILVLLMAP